MGIPLGLLAAETAAAFIGGAAYEAVNNYIKKPSSDGSAPVIPTSRRSPAKSSKTLQKESLSNYASGVGAVLAGASALVNSAVTSGKTSAESASTAQIAKTSELLGVSNASPLLTNQVYMKDSIDKLIDAINANTLVSASVFGTLDANMSAIGSSLTSISATLIEVADNYKKEISNTDDLPYINQEDYYNMLKEGGMTFTERNDLIRQEDMLYEALVAQGYEYDDIKTQIQNWRKYTVPISGQLSVEKELAGISKPPRVNSDGVSSSASSPSLELPNVEKWAESQLGINEYLTTPSDIKDLDGNIVASMKPIEAQSVKNITDARYKTDENNFELDDTDFDDMFTMPDISSIFQFDKKSVRLQNYNLA